MKPTDTTPATPTTTFEVKLPFSGKTAIVQRAKGKDMLKAARNAEDQEEQLFHLAALLTTIDGQPLTFDDMLELDILDVSALTSAVQGKAPTQS